MNDRSRETRLTTVFVKLADSLTADYDMIELLDLLVRECVGMLDSDAGGLMVADPRAKQLQLIASTSEEAGFVEVNALNAGEGPCIDCYNIGEAVTVADIADEYGRWPSFGPSAVENGFRSMHAFPLKLRDTVIGAMNLFSATPGELSPEDIRLGQALADVATISILQERSIRDSVIVTEQLQRALNTRVVIEQAKGIIAQSANLPMEEAFDALRNYSRSHGRRLSEVAAEIAERSLVITVGTFAKR